MTAVMKLSEDLAMELLVRLQSQSRARFRLKKLRLSSNKYWRMRRRLREKSFVPKAHKTTQRKKVRGAALTSKEVSDVVLQTGKKRQNDVVLVRLTKRVKLPTDTSSEAVGDTVERDESPDLRSAQ